MHQKFYIFSHNGETTVGTDNAENTSQHVKGSHVLQSPRDLRDQGS